MKNNVQWQATLALILVAMATAVYYLHFLIFRDAHHIFLYFIGDVGFVFFEVLLVTLVIHRLLYHREQKALQSKLAMLVGAFFSEMGTVLLGKLAEFDKHVHKISEPLAMPSEWSEREFLNVRSLAECHDAVIEGEEEELQSLKDYLVEKKQFMLDLLQNPNLQEDQPFTNLVWAVYHITEELVHRKDLKSLSPSDHEHLMSDIKATYPLLTVQWLDYMQHLEVKYPHRHNFANRINPFGNQPKA